MWSRRSWKRLLIWSWAERNRCAWRADLKRFICRSRRRVGWCEFSALLFRPLCRRCSTPGISSRFAAGQLASLSVSSTRGARPCFFSSLRSRRLAAFLSRRLWTSTSSTTPSWSTARHNQCFWPAILIWTSSRCHLSPARGSLRRISFANAWPNFSAHWRTVSWLTVMPRGQQLLDHPQAEREAEVEPDGVADDLRREPVAGVGGRDRRRHARPVAGSPPARNPSPANLTVPLRHRRLLHGRTPGQRQPQVRVRLAGRAVEVRQRRAQDRVRQQPRALCAAVRR